MPKNKNNPSKTRKSQQQKTLEMVLEDFKASWSYAQNNYHDTWEDAWKLYNNERTDQAYEGISNIFIPMVFSTIESMTASLAGSRPQFNFMPTNPNQNDNLRVLNAMMDFYWDADQWQSKIDKWIRSMLMYGTGVLYIWWDIDRPRLEIVPLRDFIVDPTASHPKDARFMGRRYLTTKENLASFEFVDPDTGKMKKVYKNLDRIKSFDTGNGEQTDKEEKEIFLGSTLGKEAKVKQVEVIEYWTQERVIAVANRSTVIRDDENPYMEAKRLKGEDDTAGLMPFIVQRNYQDESLIYGKGEIEPIIGLQESLNDLANQRRDAIAYQLNPMFTIDPRYSDHLETIESLPGAIYPFEAGALQKIEMGGLSADSYNEEALLKQDIRETTSADQTFKGVDSDGSKTATEIQAQLAQANSRLAQKGSQIENEGYHELAELVLSMVQLFVDEPQMIKVIGRDNGIEWQEFDPELVQGVYEPRVQLRSTIEAKKQEDALGAKEMYQIFLGDPEVNQTQLKRITMQKGYALDEEEIDLLLSPPEEEQPGEIPVDPSLLDELGGIGGQALSF